MGRSSSKNHAPVLSGTSASLQLTEGDSGATLFSGLNLTDADKGTYSGASLKVLNSNHDGNDILSINFGSGRGQFSYNAATHELLYGFGSTSATVIGQIDSINNGQGTDLCIVFNSKATASLVDKLIDKISFANADDSPTESRTLTLQVTDPAGAMAQATQVVGITPVNDAPVILAGGNSGTVTFEETAAYAPTATAHGQLIAFDPDAGDTLHWAVIEPRFEPMWVNFQTAGQFEIDSATGQWSFSVPSELVQTGVSATYEVSVTDSAGAVDHIAVTLVGQVVTPTVAPWIPEDPLVVAGRLLRVQGNVVQAQLCEGADWTQGPCPQADALDAPTRRALEALWLHDAQMEHASVPAFARISWMLAAAGAPAELMEWSIQAAREEVEHARQCFALAAGYGERTHSVKPMPELMRRGLEIQGNVLVTLATESLNDGCLMEDFAADMAHASAQVCEEPVTKALLARIAIEERSHAEFSWEVLAWALQRSPATVLPAVLTAISKLDQIARPVATTADCLPLVAQANAEQLVKHGRLTDAHLQVLWDQRLVATRTRLDQLLASIAPRLALAA